MRLTRLLPLLLALLAAPALACQIHDGLPDPACTPGATDPRVTQENIQQTICVPGYSKQVRPPVAVTNRIKRERMATYGLEGQQMRDYELDHLVSLEIGGCPDCVENFWPQPWNGPLGAHDKDAVENTLHRLVCSDRLPLAEAQRRIATDWVHALDGIGQQP
jgi:hypothetical protein